MIKEFFLRKQPAEFQLNPLVRVFILSEMMLNSAWGSVLPIFALFAVTLRGGSIETAAFGYSIYLMSRVVFELLSGRILMGASDFRKLLFSIIGIAIVSIAYLGFAFSTSTFMVFFFYVVAGTGFGIATPAKNSLFSMHLDRNREAYEWGLMDGLSLFGMSMAAFSGGLVAHLYGFMTLFLLAGCISLCSILPYVLYVQSVKE